MLESVLPQELRKSLQHIQHGAVCSSLLALHLCRGKRERGVEDKKQHHPLHADSAWLDCLQLYLPCDWAGPPFHAPTCHLKALGHHFVHNGHLALLRLHLCKIGGRGGKDGWLGCKVEAACDTHIMHSSETTEI